MIQKVPIFVFGKNSNNSEHKIDISLFVQEPHLRTNFIESNIEEYIDSESQYRITKLPDPISIRDTCNKNYVPSRNDPSKTILV